MSKNPLLEPLEGSLREPRVWTDVDMAKAIMGALYVADLFDMSVPRAPLNGPVEFFVGPQNEKRTRSSFRITVEELDCGYGMNGKIIT